MQSTSFPFLSVFHLFKSNSDVQPRISCVAFFTRFGCLIILFGIQTQSITLTLLFRSVGAVRIRFPGYYTSSSTTNLACLWYPLRSLWAEMAPSCKLAPHHWSPNWCRVYPDIQPIPWPTITLRHWHGRHLGFGSGYITRKSSSRGAWYCQWCHPTRLRLWLPNCSPH